MNKKIYIIVAPEMGWEIPNNLQGNYKKLDPTPLSISKIF